MGITATAYQDSVLIKDSTGETETYKLQPLHRKWRERYTFDRHYGSRRRLNHIGNGREKDTGTGNR
jgi:hypothetical protein